MSSVFHRTLLHDPPLAVRGEGVYLFDQSGRRYLDASGGAAVSCLGHNNAQVIAAICEQARVLPYAHTSFFSTPVLEELADRLVSRAPGLAKALFVSGGSEAMEAALKMSRQYFVDSGNPQRHLFIARKQSYHGNTLGALAVGDNERRRRPFAPLLQMGHYISPCFAYRWSGAKETPETFGLRVADELEAKILELGAENVAAFVAETVVGATLGAVPPVAGYFRRIREICDRYGVHLILDEVMCGAGRTGSWYAYEQEGITPDIVAVAKGLAAGYQPIGVVLTTEKIVGAIKAGSGHFQHGHTFMGHTTAAAAALATLNVLEKEQLLDNVVQRGESLKSGLQNVFAGHEFVGDVRGRGLFIGIEFVKERALKIPFDPSTMLHKRIKQSAFEHGLMCYPMGGTVDGRLGDHVLLAPPYIIDEDHEHAIIAKFSAAVSQVFARLHL